MAEQWRILVIESEEHLNRNMVNSLQKDGYIVRGVVSGGEAIRLLWSEEYDVVICSQHIPDADSFDLLQWMRSYCPNTRMVMLGTSDHASVRGQALEMGVASYLEKPLDLHALKEELRRLLHSTGFSASLDSFDLLDVIQIMTMSRKSIALIVNTGLEEQGILRFQNGELIWAEYGMLRGEEAFYALAAHKNGTVAHHTWNEQITPNVTQPLSRLIFQALQYRSKYADAIQASSELEAIRPMRAQALPPLPSTTLPEVISLDEDDRPFQFVSETLLAERPPTSTVSGQVNAPPGMTPGGNAPDFPRKEWWEQSRELPSLQQSGSMRAITDAPQGASAQSQSSAGQNAESVQQNALPSWLTEQPMSQPLPVLRSQTGQIPAVPKNWSPTPPPRSPQADSALPPYQTSSTNTQGLPFQVSPTHPALPLPANSTNAQGLPFQVSPAHPASPLPANSTNAQGLPNVPHHPGAVWPEMNGNPSASGLRKIKPEEALYTGRQPAIRPGSNMARTPSSAEWQGPEQATLQNGHSGAMRAVQPDMLQSLAALRKPPAPVQADATSTRSEETPMPATRSLEERAWVQPITPTGHEASVPKLITNPGQPIKYNYPALAAALQTLGYAIPGFVASAVVYLDGTPIAQVADEEIDISPLCTHLSQVMRGALQAVQQGQSDPYDYTIMSSRTRYTLLRLIGSNTNIFQILITTHETKPAESLDALANVEAAIAAALRPI